MDEFVEPLLAIHDESLKKEDVSNYILSIQFALDGLSFSLFDRSRRKYLGLWHYKWLRNILSIRHASGYNVICCRFEQIYRSNEWLGLKYDTVRIMVEGIHTTLIPEDIFDAALVDQYLILNYGDVDGERVKSEYLPSVRAHNVYSVREEFLALLEKYFPQAHLIHHGSSLIEYVMRRFKSQQEGEILFLNIHAKAMDIVVFDRGKLKYYNLFKCFAVKDYLYYMLFVMEQLRFHVAGGDVYVVGDTRGCDDIVKELRKYVKEVRYLSRAGDVKYSYGFDELSDRDCFNLLNFVLCE